MRFKDPEYLKSLGLIQLFGQLFSISIFPSNSSLVPVSYFCCASAARDFSLIENEVIDKRAPMGLYVLSTASPLVAGVRLLYLASAVISLTGDDSHESVQQQLPVSDHVWPAAL